MYVPFGNYDGFCLTDPLTLELGETRESAGLVGFEYAGFSGSFAGFNGDVETDDKDTVNNFTAALSYTYENEDMSVTLGGSYIYNMSDSDGLQDAVSELNVNEAAGIDAFLTAGFMGIGLSVEYVTATDELADELAIEPSALSIDLGYEFTESIAAAVRYETADDVEELELPDDRYGACIGWTFNATDLGATTLTAEYMHEEYADDSNNDLLTLQVSFEI
jgi:predicted porin